MGEGQVGVDGEVGEEGDVAVGEGAGLEAGVEGVQGRGGVRPGSEAVPDLRDGVDFGGGEERGEGPGGEEGV